MFHDLWQFFINLLRNHNLLLCASPGDTSEDPTVTTESGDLPPCSEKSSMNPAKMSPFKHSPHRSPLFRKPNAPLMSSGSVSPAVVGEDSSARANLLSVLNVENKENFDAIANVDKSDTVSDSVTNTIHLQQKSIKGMYAVCM